MNSRERINLTCNHQEPDILPVDFGGGMQTGMHVSIVYQLRQALGLDAPGIPVKVIEVYQMLGEIKPDLMDALGLDVISLAGNSSMFGFPMNDLKEFVLSDGTPTLVPGKFNTDYEPNGDLLQYPEGDKSIPASGRMTKNGFFFDGIIRQQPVDDENLNVEDNTEEFKLISAEELNHYKNEADRLYKETDKAIFTTFGGLTFGDIALVPAPFLKHPKGIRDIEEWYISGVIRRDHIKNIYERQVEIAIENLKHLYEAVGNKISIICTSSTDFGFQNGSFLSPEDYREMYLPYQKQINDWIHEHTLWKSFMHCCGSIVTLLDEIVAAGFDIINPVQCSAAGMDPKYLKEKFGDRLTFWGGGVNTQLTLPFGSPDDVKKEARERITIFSKRGGFVFNSIHNIQAKTPIKNLLAMFDVLKEFRKI